MLLWGGGGGGESEGVGDGRLRKLVSVGGTEVHAVLSEGEEVSVGGEEGREGRVGKKSLGSRYPF